MSKTVFLLKMWFFSYLTEYFSRMNYIFLKIKDTRITRPQHNSSFTYYIWYLIIFHIFSHSWFPFAISHISLSPIIPSMCKSYICLYFFTMNNFWLEFVALGIILFFDLGWPAARFYKTELDQQFFDNTKTQAFLKLIASSSVESLYAQCWQLCTWNTEHNSMLPMKSNSCTWVPRIIFHGG